MASWKCDVLHCIKKIDSPVFGLSDVYQFEKELSPKHPQNNNVRAKIRQQLQMLREDGVLRFLDDKGNYEKMI